MRAISYQRGGAAAPFDSIELDAQARHLRRKLITSRQGTEVLVDFEKPVALRHGDCLVLDDGRLVEVIAAREELMEVTGGKLLQLAWHIGNRHLEAQIETSRILIRRDHVIAHMLEHQGARVRDVTETFTPEHGAYHDHSH